MIKSLDEKDMPELFLKATQALREAVETAIAEHWRNGRPVYVWRDERVVALYPDGSAVPVEDQKSRSLP